jgi:hypothetical protein
MIRGGIYFIGFLHKYPSILGINENSVLKLRPIQSPIEWETGALFLEVKRPGLEADHSHPSSAEVKNAWSYNSTPQYTFMALCSVKAQLLKLFIIISPSWEAISHLASQEIPRNLWNRKFIAVFTRTQHSSLS